MTERPLFSTSVYDFGIDENQPAGSQVGLLSAHDADSPLQWATTSSCCLQGAYPMPLKWNWGHWGDDNHTALGQGGADGVWTDSCGQRHQLPQPQQHSHCVHLCDWHQWQPPTFTFPTPTTTLCSCLTRFPWDTPSPRSQRRIWTGRWTETSCTRWPRVTRRECSPLIRKLGCLCQCRLEKCGRQHDMAPGDQCHRLMDPPLSSTTPLHIVLNHSLALGRRRFSSLFQGTNFIILIVVGACRGPHSGPAHCHCGAAEEATAQETAHAPIQLPHACPPEDGGPRNDGRLHQKGQCIPQQ